MNVRRAFRTMLALFCLLPVVGDPADAQTRPEEALPPKKQKKPKFDVVAAEPLVEITGSRLSGDAAYDNQPAIAMTADGTTWVAWVSTLNHGADEVVVASGTEGRFGAPTPLTPAPGQFIRPVLAASGNDVWCLWTASFPERVASIWHSRRTAGAWSPPARILPDESCSHQNPEIAAGPDGRVAAVYQVHTGAGYDIHLRLWDGKSWGEPRALSGNATGDWDPAAAYDSKGSLHVVWSGFADGDYDIYAARIDLGHGTLDLSPAAPRRISSRGDYDLHPWLAAAPDGAIWVSWDVVRIPNHGRSGRTTITGANLRGNDDVSHGMSGMRAGVEVRVLDGDAVRVPGRPREEIVAPKGYLLAHCALGKVAVGARGEPWIVYRALRRELEFAGIGFHWELQARPFRDGRWGTALRFGNSDGYLEEAGLAAAPDGLRVAYSTEHRRSFIPQKDPSPDPPPAEAAGAAGDHHRDFDRGKGWKGDVLIAALPAADAAPFESASLPEEKAPADRPVEERPSRDIGRYDVRAGATTYRLLWGDTHRHSNVSRCSHGGEPTPDDHYRYGADICRYDFFALSDHAEDPRLTPWDVIDYYWWRQQKLADLYHVPGFMSVLYNLEWSLIYPHGHHNTVFPSRPTVRLDRSLAASSTLAGGWKILEQAGVKAITIPPTGADPRMGTGWEVQDDRYQRLCEIFQACRGSYEHAGCPREFSQTDNKKGFYWNALEKGYHVGIIASTDHGYGVSYACVYAPENTRADVWQAMWDRRTYGSTTYGLVLDLRSGEHWMGEAWASKEAPVLDLYVRGAAPIRSVEILGRSKVLHAEGSVEKPLNAREHRLRWIDPDWAAQSKEQWYYARVIQTDDEMAWSSPVWVVKD